MSSYSAVAQQIIQTTPPPYPMHCDVVEYESEKGALYLQIYVQEYCDLAEYKVAEIADWLNGLLKRLNTHPLITEKYAPRVSEEVPNGRRS